MPARPLTIRTLLTGLAACAAALAAASMQGCNYATAAAYIIGGGPKILQQFELDDTKKTVVFVDDRRNAIPRRSLRRVVGQQAEETLLAEKQLKPELVIASNAAHAAVSQERASAVKSVVDVGLEIGAEQVIYVTVEQFTLTRDGVSNTPHAAGYVRVIDVVNNRRIWPAEGPGHPVVWTASTQTAELPRSTAERAVAEEKLARRFGLSVARVFFEHEKSTLDGRLDD